MEGCMGVVLLSQLPGSCIIKALLGYVMIANPGKTLISLILSQMNHALGREHLAGM
jgi:hypothetical protein